MLASTAFALLAAASAFDPSQTFHYVKYPRIFRRNEVACQVCYGEFDCLSMESCGYDFAVSEVLEEHDPMKTVNDGLKTKVDSMMYDLVLEDSIKQYKECVPFISSYTTCSKENTCLGCKSCDCNESGNWNCSETSKCSNVVMNVDHEVLASVIDGLKDANPSRYKRSHFDPEARSIYENLMDWIEVTPSDNQVKNDNTSRSPVFGTSIDTREPVPRGVEAFVNKMEREMSYVTTTESTRNITSDDNNNLVFDDILSYDNLEYFIKYSDQEIMNNDKNYENNDSYHFLKFLKNIEEGKADISQIDNSRRHIDILQNLKKYMEKKSEINEPSNSQSNGINTSLTDTEDIDVDKQPSDFNSIASVVKRNVDDVNETSIQNKTKTSNMTRSFDNGSKNVTYSHSGKDNGSKNFTYSHLEKDKENRNVTYSEKEIQHIIDIITVLIGNERKEINHLIYVRDSLLKLFRKYQINSNGTEIIHNQISDDDSRKHGNWKVDLLNFYTKNLKRDVKDTLRDIYAIQNLKKLGVDYVAASVSNLKPLLFALTSYYLKNFRNYLQTEHNKQHSNSTYTQETRTTTVSSIIHTTLITNISTINQIHNSETKPQRRASQPSFSNVYQSQLIKRALTRMLLMIDNDMLSTSAFSPLSTKTKNILKRIVHKQHAKDFAYTHPTLRDPNFNLTKILTSLAKLWEHLPSQTRESNPADRLYNMKLLHLTLSQGIDRLTDALVLVQFGYSRRMTFIEEYDGKALIADIARQLATLENQIIHHAVANDVDTDFFTPKRDYQTESVWDSIKTALLNSKNNLVKYFQGRFKPRSYIVNDKVRKRVEEVNKLKFLEVMKKWQKHFDTYRARNKRSVQQQAKRMKNIIPKYLRGIKVNPVLKGNQKNSRKPVIKAPVIHKAPMQSKKSVGVQRNPKNSTPHSTKLRGGRTQFPRIPAVKALPRHMEARKSHHTVLARKGSVKGLAVHQTTPRHLKGQPKRGVRSQQKH